MYIKNKDKFRQAFRGTIKGFPRDSTCLNTYV